MRGQTLIEVLVALALAALIISAISIAVITSLNNAIFSKNQNSATQYAQEGMEIMKRLKDTNWNTFNNYGVSVNNYCLDKGSTLLREMQGNKCGQNIDIFMRQVKIEKSNSDCKLEGSATLGTRLTVSVFWNDGKCKNQEQPFCNKAEVVSCFTDANMIQAP